MPKIKLRCLDVTPKARGFTVGKIYQDCFLNVDLDKKAKTLSIVNDFDKHKIGPCEFNSSKELQAESCAFKVILVQ